ncbi:MAG TPA: hypothetical protein VMW42_03600 [Desulfatiglandales bacterium]|nr:hypothetical protein [Desulfatiglandales bacterium]
MRSGFIISIFLLAVLCNSLFAAELREIELTDGSVILGETISFKDGVYTIKSSGLGIIKIEESKILAIRRPRGSSPEAGIRSSDTSINADIESLKKLLMGDKDIMDEIRSLQNDPDLQEVLQDPVIIEALNSGDMEALLSNPKFISLLGNPKIQKIISEVVK